MRWQDRRPPGVQVLHDAVLGVGVIVVATAASGLIVGLDEAILVGVVRLVALFMPRAAKMKVTELIVAPGGVVRARRDGEAADDNFLVFDFEGELFFGIAPELERTFRDIRARLETGKIDKLLLRLKRVRNPDVVMLEQLEHFLKELQAEGIDVWLAGLRPDLLTAMDRLGFADWFPTERLLAHGAEDYSATLTAIADIRAGIGARAAITPVVEKFYYLV